MQILYPHSVSIQQYIESVASADACRPDQCPQCEAKDPLKAHGFYRRTIADAVFDGIIRIRRFLCRRCQRTVSLLPEWALPFGRFSIPEIARVLCSRLVDKRSWADSGTPYRRGQHWVRRFRRGAEAAAAALGAVTAPEPAADFAARALAMLERTGWIPSHRFLFSTLRMHLLGWGSSLAPHGRFSRPNTGCGLPQEQTHSTGMAPGEPSG